MHCVIGFGPAGVACARALLARGANVLMLDAGLELEPERAAIALFPHRHDARAEFFGDGWRTFGAAVVGDDDFAAHNRARWRPNRAVSTQRAIVSASFRQGMTMLNSAESAMEKFYSNAPAFGERGF